jgi:hypothetical protein
MERKYLIASVGILVAFAIGLVGFFAFSADLPDGLDRTMEESGVDPGDPLFTAPLGYGDDYLSSLIMGIVGFAVTLVVALGFFKLRKSIKAPGEE